MIHSQLQFSALSLDEDYLFIGTLQGHPTLEYFEKLTSLTSRGNRDLSDEFNEMHKESNILP